MSTMKVWGSIPAIVAVMVVAWASPGASQGEEGKYSGRVVAADRTSGAIVVEGMGPWRVKDGVTQVERRTVAVTPSTEFVSVKRASGPAPSGWVGDFVESALPGWGVKPGDWVTVTPKADGKQPAALRIHVWQPTEG